MRPPQLRAAELLRLLERLGYERVSPPGGHIKMRKLIRGKEHNVTVPMHKGHDLPRWLMAQLLKRTAEANDKTIEELLDLL